MKTCKAITIDLLKEIKAVCEQENIRYFLSGELVRFEKEQTEFKDAFNNGAIAVFAKDIDKLAALLGEKENRKIESLATNSKFPGFYVRYMDTSTTLINFAETVFTYDTNSLGVNIEIICGRKKNGFKGKVLSKLKRLWVQEHAPYFMTKRRGEKTLKQKLVTVFFRAVKHTSLMKKMYSVWIREGKTETKLCDIANNRGEIIKYRTDIFDSTVRTKWVEGEFDVVRKKSKYLDNYFESNKIIKPVMHDIVAFDVPWEQVGTSIRKHNISLEEYQSNQREYLKWKRTVYNPMGRKRDRFYSYMFCAEDRMYFYKEFNGEKKEQILALHQAGELEQLREILAEYIRKINYYAKHFVGFCSDAEIFRVAMSVMLYDEYLANKNLPEFKKRCKRLFNIINNTNYRHFDSVENVFWGEREDAAVLKARKVDIRRSVVQEAKGYYRKFGTGKRN